MPSGNEAEAAKGSGAGNAAATIAAGAAAAAATASPFSPSGVGFTPRAILLTGGAGFIGSNQLLYLARAYPQYTLVCLDKLDVCSSLASLSELEGHPRFVFVRGDICNAALVRRLCQTHHIDTIMHFASQTHVDNSFGNSLAFTYANVQGTHTLLECALSLGGQIRRFLHVSTDEVYGEQEGHRFDDERAVRSREHSTPLNPTNPYAATKAAAEFLVKSYRASFQLPTIITRGNNVYGPRQYPEKLIPKFTALLSRGLPCPLHGDGRHRRSFLHVDDVCRAFDVILHRGVVGEIYNIGSDDEYENVDILHRLIRLFRRKYPHCLDARLPDSAYATHVRDRAFNDFRYHIDSTSLRQLGWTRQVTDLDQGLESTVEWYMQHPHHWDNVEAALAPHPYLLPDLGQGAYATPPIRDMSQAKSGAAERARKDSLADAGASAAAAAVLVDSTAAEQRESSASILEHPRPVLMASPPPLSSAPPLQPPTIGGSAAAASFSAAGVSSPAAAASASAASSPSVGVRSSRLRWLLFGHRGWIAAQFLRVLAEARSQDEVLLAVSRADEEDAVEAELMRLRPDRVVCMIGRTHGPDLSQPGHSTIDYLEEPGRLRENVRDNLFAPIVLLHLAARHRVHFTYLGTGCIYAGDEPDSPDSLGAAFDEEALPNFFGSAYSTVKGFTDRLFRLLSAPAAAAAGVGSGSPGALNARIRMPISAEDGHPRNLLTKLTTYSRICSVTNSLSVLPSLLPVLVRMIVQAETGTVNLVNPGPLAHNEVLTLWRDRVDPSFTWQEWSAEQQDAALPARRSNNVLCTERLQAFAPDVLDTRTALAQVLDEIAARRKITAPVEEQAVDQGQK